MPSRDQIRRWFDSTSSVPTVHLSGSIDSVLVPAEHSNK